MARLLEQYNSEIRSQLAEMLDIKNPMRIPRLSKVVVSMACCAPTVDKNRLPAAAKDLTKITGQKAEIRRAQKSVSNFKLRKDMEIGCRVTLRGRRMYEFLDRLVNTAVPRLRDFRGLNHKSFDGRGNYSFGLPDQTVFAEIDLDKVTHHQGMNVTFVTTAERDSDARALLTLLGVPFRKTEERQN